MNDKFIKIFNLYKNDVYRLAYSYTKNKSDTDDIAQNVFIKLYIKSVFFNKKNVFIKFIVYSKGKNTI